MNKILLIVLVIGAGLGAYLYSTYKLVDAPSCTQGAASYDCIEGKQCAGLVCDGKCITSFNDCGQCSSKLICEGALAQ